MSSYDFKQLSPHDFELLARDLLQARDNLLLESFKSGRDWGIDFRHSKNGKNIIVQCKHYVRSGLSKLLGDLKNEALKLKKLNATRYILVTSIGLSPANKSEIQNLFGSVLATYDIIGCEDLNNLLDAHPKVHQMHYKLWLASRVVLDRVIHNASITQSEFDIEQVYRDIHRYVRNSAYPRALAMLESDHVTIISGAPGVGKTSLAKMLLYSYLEKGYESISILTDFQTGRQRYQPGRKQIFYFDDFIGATFLGEQASAFTRNEDRAILDFIEMVRRSPSARLVMTTREHILRQAVEASEKLKHSTIITSRCVLEISDYSREQKAEILYNHIYFSDLPKEYRLALLSGRFYHEVVGHKKFNPRLIDWLSTFHRVQSIPPEQYQDFVRGLLSNPDEIWRHAYEHQISDAARSVLLSLHTLRGKCGPLILEQAFSELHALRAQKYGFKRQPSDWRRSLGELNGSFVRPGKKIEVLDPSVLDMLNSVIREDVDYAFDLIEGAVSFEQVRRVWTFGSSTDSNKILIHFAANISKLAAALERALAMPAKNRMEDRTIYFDDKEEMRVTTAIQMAERLRSALLCRIATNALDSLISSWHGRKADVGSGLNLLHEISISNFVFPSTSQSVRSTVISALVSAASQGCRSDQLRELLGTIDPSETTPELDDGLRLAAEEYRYHYSDSEISECKSESDFNDLEDDISTIADRTGMNFDDVISRIREALSEFEENQAAYEDQQYEQWKDYRSERGAEQQGLDDLFDSLKSIE